MIVSDLRGVLPLFGEHIPAIADARQRHLKSGGTLIPKRDNLWVALVEAGRVYKELLEPWDHPYGLAMDEARLIALNSWSADDTEGFRPGSLLMAPYKWTVLDYESITEPNVVSIDSSHQATRDGTAHGLLIWFDAELFKGIGFSNGPQATKPAEVYGRGFFPLLSPVSIAEGDLINLTIRAELINGEYDWYWSTRIQDQADPASIKAVFDQSSATGSVFTTGPDGGRSGDSRPFLGEEGRVDHFIMGKMDGQATLLQIAQESRNNFPDRFKDQQEALLHVYNIAQQYRGA